MGWGNRPVWRRVCQLKLSFLMCGRLGEARFLLTLTVIPTGVSVLTPSWTQQGPYVKCRVHGGMEVHDDTYGWYHWVLTPIDTLHLTPKKGRIPRRVGISLEEKTGRKMYQAE